MHPLNPCLDFKCIPYIALIKFYGFGWDRLAPLVFWVTDPLMSRAPVSRGRHMAGLIKEIEQRKAKRALR